jgi:Mn2+/Fe2+ NRAMP family transporter
MDATQARSASRLSVAIRGLSLWGPGLLVMLADTDAGNIVTAAQTGAQWSYRLLPLVLFLILPLFLVQELTVRLGVSTRRGHGELILNSFGLRWAALSTAGLVVATVGSLVTEFAAIADIGERFGLSRTLTLPAAVAVMLTIVATGSYRRAERAALIIGLFELAFFRIAWAAHPNLMAMATDAIDIPLVNRDFLFLIAAVVGTTFNPWMIFYQQSATVDKGLREGDLAHARRDTLTGAILTQALTGAVLVAVAATFARGGERTTSFSSVSEIGDAFALVVGGVGGRVLFIAGVLGASMVAAIVASLALAWGVGEVAGYRRSLEQRPFEARWFYGVYAACLTGAAVFVWASSNLVSLNIAAQVLNAFLMPPVIGTLILLAVKALPEPVRLRGIRLWFTAGSAALVCALGLVCGVQALI